MDNLEKEKKKKVWIWSLKEKMLGSYRVREKHIILRYHF